MKYTRMAMPMRPKRPCLGRNRASGTAISIRMSAITGVEMRHCNSARSRGSLDCNNSAGGLHARLAGAPADLTESNRIAAFGEMRDLPVALAGRAFVMLAVVQHEHLIGLPGAALLGPGRDPDLQLAVALRILGPIHEHIHVVQDAVVIDALGIEHHVAAAERPESAGFEQAELRILQSFGADLLGSRRRGGNGPERQPDQQGGNERRRDNAIGRYKPAGPTPQDWIAAISLS